MDADPCFAGEATSTPRGRSWGAATTRELFLYPGDQHLFADSSLAGLRRRGDRRLLTQRVLEFLAD